MYVTISDAEVREISQQREDVETMRRWERLHARYIDCRGGASRLEEEMREAAPEYCRAMHRESRRWDAEHDGAA
jgi:hypothetical protein